MFKLMATFTFVVESIVLAEAPFGHLSTHDFDITVS